MKINGLEDGEGVCVCISTCCVCMWEVRVIL